jgi:hypothetical protein
MLMIIKMLNMKFASGFSWQISMAGKIRVRDEQEESNYDKIE